MQFSGDKEERRKQMEDLETEREETERKRKEKESRMEERRRAITGKRGKRRVEHLHAGSIDSRS